MDCLFCKIAKGEIPSKKIYGDSDVFAFLDINPCSLGHALVIPKKHHQFITDMSAEEISVLFNAAVMMAKRCKHVLGAEAVNIGINDGKAAGAEVSHVHVHVIPRYANDGGGAMQSIVRMHVDRSKFDETAEKLSSTEEKHDKKPSYDDFFR